MSKKPQLTVEQILSWADAHHKRTGAWPTVTSAPVHDAPEENWAALSAALRGGFRGLPEGGALTQLLAEHRGVPKYLNRKHRKGTRPRLSVEQILTWADAHYQRTGKYPTESSGPVHDAPTESWGALSSALRAGCRGLPGGGSLPRLLAKQRGVARKTLRPRLSIKQILTWADAHHQRTGKWPKITSGPVHGVPGESWSAVSCALDTGLRGLPGGSSLAQLLAKHRGVPKGLGRPKLTVKQILAWADAHYQRTGEYPKERSGAVRGAPGENWRAVSGALREGRRGLRGGSSLPQLLAKHRGTRMGRRLPAVTVNQILAWADAHHARTGTWPREGSGAVHDAPGETWARITESFYRGGRGLRRGSSLAQVLAKHRGVPTRACRKPPKPKGPRLTVRQILTWVDDYHRRTGKYPTQRSGPVYGAPQENWRALAQALRLGYRGLRGGSSLPELLAKHRGRWTRLRRPRLTIKQILAWADAHHRQTGEYPTQRSGAVRTAPEVTWHAISTALREGSRGLRGGSSLARLLAKHRGVPYRRPFPRLTTEQILSWVDTHHKRTGQWPTRSSGSLLGKHGGSWARIDDALRRGVGDLPGGSSLARLLHKRRGVRNRSALPRLTIKQILSWADAHHKRTGRWPMQSSGSVPGGGGQSWVGVDHALRWGTRGLRGGSSLARLLAKHRGVINQADRPPLTIKKILRWADEYHSTTGRWPATTSGPVRGAPGESWGGISNALRAGRRGLKAIGPLAQLLYEQRGVLSPWALPRLRVQDIREWAIQHHVETGRWPTAHSGPVRGTRDESWGAIDQALRAGGRGLAGGSSLAKVLRPLRRPLRRRSKKSH